MAAHPHKCGAAAGEELIGAHFSIFPLRKDHEGWSNESVAPAHATRVQQQRRRASTELQHVTHFHTHPSC